MFSQNAGRSRHHAQQHSSTNQEEADHIKHPQSKTTLKEYSVDIAKTIPAQPDPLRAGQFKIRPGEQMRGQSTKPCPGCGQIGCYRKSNEVCNDCKLKIKRSEFLEKELTKLTDDEIIVTFGRASHWNKYLHTHSGAGRNLMDIFQRIAESASRESMIKKSDYVLLGKIDSFAEQYSVMPKKLADAIKDLRIDVEKAIEEEYKCGKKDGQNLLHQLASGDLSVNDFNERTLNN